MRTPNTLDIYTLEILDMRTLDTLNIYTPNILDI